jgi:hypothetical protein
MQPSTSATITAAAATTTAGAAATSNAAGTAAMSSGVSTQQPQTQAGVGELVLGLAQPDRRATELHRVEVRATALPLSLHWCTHTIAYELPMAL